MCRSIRGKYAQLDRGPRGISPHFDLAEGFECQTSCYHDGMTKKTTTVRMPDELAETVEVVARARGISVNTLVIDALTSEIERVKRDQHFMEQLRELTIRDKEILDRLAE